LTAVVKLFLKRPDQAQGLVQKVLQAATAESDNPDIRDRAYVYWRLLSSDPQITKNVVLSQRPPIHTTIKSLPPVLLDQLVAELSTLASVYHKPPAAFLGQGRFAAAAMQQMAIDEQEQNALENPLAAAAAAAAVSGNALAQQTTAENLLDIDFDGAAPASSVKEAGSGLDDLASTGQQSSNTNDLADIFSGSNGTAMPQQAGHNDLMSGFANLNMRGAKEPPPASQQLHGNAGGNASAGGDLLDLI